MGKCKCSRKPPTFTVCHKLLLYVHTCFFQLNQIGSDSNLEQCVDPFHLFCLFLQTAQKQQVSYVSSKGFGETRPKGPVSSPF